MTVEVKNVKEKTKERQNQKKLQAKCEKMSQFFPNVNE